MKMQKTSFAYGVVYAVVGMCAVRFRVIGRCGVLPMASQTYLLLTILVSLYIQIMNNTKRMRCGHSGEYNKIKKPLI